MHPSPREARALLAAVCSLGHEAHASADWSTTLTTLIRVGLGPEPRPCALYRSALTAAREVMEGAPRSLGILVEATAAALDADPSGQIPDAVWRAALTAWEEVRTPPPRPLTAQRSQNRETEAE